MIVPFAGPKENIPDGWLLCDGRTISRSEYFNLYKAIGSSWGSGDGSTTFNLPDLRGMFLRGVSGNSGNDADAENRTMLLENGGGNIGNNVGSYQGDAIRNITGSIDASQQPGPCQSFGEINSASITGAFEGIWSSQANTRDGDYSTMLRGFIFNASRVVPTGSDNRPKNVYVTYIIKY
jgi:phage-related tail fiber protein